MNRSYSPTATHPHVPRPAPVAALVSLSVVADVVNLLHDVDAHLIPVPARPLDQCGSCPEGDWPPLDPIAYVSYLQDGRAYDETVCELHARPVVAWHRRYGRPLVVCVPMVVLDGVPAAEWVSA